MAKQKSKRIKVVLPVRVGRTDDAGRTVTFLLHTLDISRTGARLGGFDGEMQVGDIVSLECRNQKLRCRVIWIGSPKKQLQFGVESLQPGKEIWGVPLPNGEGEDYFGPTSTAARAPVRQESNHERQRHPRYSVAGEASLFNLRGQEGRAVRIKDISLQGCFIETDSPADVNTRLRLLIKLQEGEIDTFVVARTCFPGVGMGVEFTQMSSTDSERLRLQIARLEREALSLLEASTSPQDRGRPQDPRIERQDTSRP
jgi:hypothetical protein